MSREYFNGYVNYGCLGREKIPVYTSPVQGEPWYVESWYDEDLKNALEAYDIPVTPENIARLKQECLNLFEDKTDRNEMLSDIASRLF